MAARSPVRRRLVSAVANLERHHPEDPRIPELRAELAAEKIADHIAKVVASAPPLSAAQRERLALLLHPGTVRDAT
jgi:hypothetical protein